MRALAWALGLAGLLAAGPLAAAGDWVPGGAEDAASLEQGLSAQGGISEAEKGGTLADRLALGGTASSTLDHLLFEGRDPQDNWLSFPNQAFIYADAHLSEDARLLLRTRLAYDPTLPQATSATALAGITSTSDARVSLEEFKLSFNLKKRVFVTLGRQKIKHGAGFFFNPTDFLNAVPRDIFLRQDERPGVDLLKVHVPVGAANLYAIGLMNQAAGAQQVGAYGRVEAGYKGLGEWLGGGEASLSALERRGQPSRFGFDVSQALGDFDAVFEMAAGKDSADEWQTPHSVGLSYEWRYADRATNTLTLRAEYLEAGKIGRSGALMLVLPEPGSLNDWTWILTTLADFPSQTGLTRLDSIWQMTREISLTFYQAVSWGVPGGLLRPPYALGDVGTRFDVVF